MYADLAADASFWNKLTEIDFGFLHEAIAKGCPLCGGPLHIANYQRKPRGIPDGVAEVFATRCSACCGHCRKRLTPCSVRFLGRRVYAGAIVLLATMTALVSGAARRTLKRWSTWWTQVLPETRLWLSLRARFVPAIPASALPAGLLQRLELPAGHQSERALVGALRLLMPLTSHTAARTVDEGGMCVGHLTQKTRIDEHRRGLVTRSQAPPPTKT